MMLAVRRAGVTMAAGALQQAGLIRTVTDRSRLLDPSGLEEVSCECFRLIRIKSWNSCTEAADEQSIRRELATCIQDEQKRVLYAPVSTRVDHPASGSDYPVPVARTSDGHAGSKPFGNERITGITDRIERRLIKAAFFCIQQLRWPKQKSPP